MSIARDATGNIRGLHTKASGLSNFFRDASGGTGGTRIWQKDPMPIHTPGKGVGSNPYSRITRCDTRQVEGRDGKAGSSSTSRPSPPRQTTKRRKLGHPQGDVSKYFSNETPVRRGSWAIPSTSTSSRPSSTTVTASANAIIIDAEDDAPATNDDSHEPILLRTSFLDPMDGISPNDVSYVFDQIKPSPIHTFSSSLEEKRKSPQDRESTLRVRNAMKKSEMRTTESVSRPDSDGDEVLRVSKILPGLLSRNAAAQAEASYVKVKEAVAFFEGRKQSSTRHINLEQLSRKNGMKRKQMPRRDIAAIPVQHLDPDATRSSGFASGTKPSTKGKAAAGGVFVHLPLKEWSIAVAIPSQEATSGDANLVWEAGVLKVRHANSGSTPFELQAKKGSLYSVKYVDIKRTTTTDPLIQIRPSLLACVKNCTQSSFKPGSADPDGLLTFKFDTSASGWDNDVYMAIVQKLVDSLSWKTGKSILDGPGARAVWEAVTRGHGNTSIINDPEPMVPKENPPNPPSKPRPRPRGDANAVADIFVGRSARLSGVKEERFSPRPDPDDIFWNPW